MTFANASHFASVAVPYSEPDGREVVIAIVKATFVRRRDGRVVLADRQVPVCVSDVPYFTDAEESSIRYPSDICTEKRGTDLVVVGEAIARRPTPVVDIALKVRERVVSLRVHGERVYHRGLAGIAVGPAAPYERKPVVYERSYGGKSSDFALVERRNPVGRGLARTADELVDTAAPTIEHPAHPILTAEDGAEPVGLGAIGSHWLPRAGYAGTFDDTWRRSRMPLLPLDFDIRYNNVASPALWFEEPLAAGDSVALFGMHEDGLWQFELPVVPLRLSARLHDGRTLTLRPPIDTVLVEPGTNEVQLTLRHAFPVGRGKSLLREIRIDEAEVPHVPHTERHAP
jgi:hypothetical protein